MKLRPYLIVALTAGVLAIVWVIRSHADTQPVQSPVWNFFSTPADRVKDQTPAAPIIMENGQEVAVVRIGDSEYHVPTGYRRYVPMKLHAVEPDLLINAALPDLHFINPGSVEAITASPQTLLILVTDAQSTTNAAFRLKVARERYAPLQPTGTLYGLASYLGSKGLHGILDFDIAHFNKDFSESNKDAFHASLLIYDEGSDHPLYIECAGDKGSLNPSCNEIFEEGHLLYDITFSKSHLSEWKDIKKATVSLLQQFKRVPSGASASQQIPTKH